MLQMLTISTVMMHDVSRISETKDWFYPVTTTRWSVMKKFEFHILTDSDVKIKIILFLKIDYQLLNIDFYCLTSLLLILKWVVDWWVLNDLCWNWSYYVNFSCNSSRILSHMFCFVCQSSTTTSFRLPLQTLDCSIVFRFRSTPKSRPNNMGQMSVRMSVHPSVRPHKVLRFRWNWYAGRGRWVMHDGMPYDPIQGQVHETFKVRNSSIFRIYLLRRF